MRFYQAYGKDFQCDVRDTVEECFKDLKNRFYEVVAMRYFDNGTYFDPNREIGIATIDV